MCIVKEPIAATMLPQLTGCNPELEPSGTKAAGRGARRVMSLPGPFCSQLLEL